jgi:hypothetical protein
MKELTQEQKDKIVSEAKTWIGTRYRGWSRVKGVAADCGQLLAAVYTNTEHLPKEILNDLPTDYRIDVAQHQASKDYVNLVSKFMDEITEPEAREGDVVVYKEAGQLAYAHGGIIVAWHSPKDFDVVDAQLHGGVRIRHGYNQPKFVKAEKRYFRLKEQYTR